MAATWWRRLPQKLHRSARSASLTGAMVAMGVLAGLLVAANTACTRSMHSLQMYTLGPAISFLICFWCFPQNEHDNSSPEPARPLRQLRLPPVASTI